VPVFVYACVFAIVGGEVFIPHIPHPLSECSNLCYSSAGKLGHNVHLCKWVGLERMGVALLFMQAGNVSY